MGNLKQAKAGAKIREGGAAPQIGVVEREIFIDFDPGSGGSKILLTEDGEPAEYFDAASGADAKAGGIYIGAVENIMPGMQSAFVNIGLERNAVLYARDVKWPTQGAQIRPIETVLRIGQKLMVQIEKAADGSKGARVSCRISLPGRYAVLMPGAGGAGVSKKITDPDSRERLSRICRESAPEGAGVVARTESEAAGQDEIVRDIESLAACWNGLLSKYKDSSAPLCLYDSQDAAKNVLRDFLGSRLKRVVVSNESKQLELAEYAEGLLPGSGSLIRLFPHEGYGLFEFYGFSRIVKELDERKVHLKCGGNIVIDCMEAMTVVDVNTGKYAGAKSSEEAFLKVNLEAAAEIARQLRLRDIGGIIVIDFIDMGPEENKRAVLKLLKNELLRDRKRATVAGMTSLGLVEMTRQKT